MDKERCRVATNIWTARVIPIVLAGVVGYATYVLVALLSVHYLLVKHNDAGAAIPVLVIYFILFILMTASFLRLVYITTFDPPYVPLGPSARIDRNKKKERGKYSTRKDRIANGEDGPGTSSSGTSTETSHNDPNSPGLELFYTKDVFTCEGDGRPRWCSQCANWKPDRAHHCGDAGRCIRKMDHFCPWVGGPVGENNFKFFIQFTGYTALYCIHLLVVMSIYVRKQSVTEGESVNPQFCAIIGLAAFFGLFTGGMTLTSLELAMFNQTQVERLGSKTRYHTLAVLKPPEEVLHSISPYYKTPVDFTWITYPLAANPPASGQASHGHESVSIDRQTASPVSDSPRGVPSTAHSFLEGLQSIPLGNLVSISKAPHNNEAQMSTSGDSNVPSGEVSTEHSENPPTDPSVGVTFETPPASNANNRPREPLSSRDLQATRTFAVLQMEPGKNPWELGSLRANLQEVMGTNVFDWLLPVRRSPCCDHENPESQFRVGPVVGMLKANVYFMRADDMRTMRGGKSSDRRATSDKDSEGESGSNSRRRRRRRRRSHLGGTQKGEDDQTNPSSNTAPIPMENLEGDTTHPQG